MGMKNAQNGMGTWKRRKLVKGNRRSVTSGREKGMVPSAEWRTICRRNRSYKMRHYGRLMSKYNGNKVRTGGKAKA